MSQNLPEDVRNFPFPFSRGTYKYSVDVQVAGSEERTELGSWGRHTFRVDDSYEESLRRRRRTLERDPARHQSLPHMGPAQWDAALFVCRSLAADYPAWFSLERDGQSWLWINRRTAETTTFVLGDEASLGQTPLEFAASQVGEDLILLDEREGKLWADAGVLTSGSIWSMAFNVGMSFAAIHGPVPGGGPQGIFARAEQFILRLDPGEVYRRLNWGLQTNGDADLSMESYEQWLPTRQSLAGMQHGEGDARDMHLRVEVQHIARLPMTGAVLFAIDIRLLSIADLARVPTWAQRTIDVLTNLPPELREYKGIEGIDDAVVRYLRSVTAAVG